MHLEPGIPQERIRNFSIIAHIDHGKSTLADRLLERTGGVSSRKRVDQVLDSMDLERERGITIKLQAVRLNYRSQREETYMLNLIDTPGHVDFSYEVSRSLAACEGALLVVDASQGIEAQTLANLYLAFEHDLEIIPVLNKIDLPGANPDKVLRELENLMGFTPEQVLRASAKTGEGVAEILEAIVERIPPPGGSHQAPTRALIFDSYYDSYRGVVPHIRVVEGVLEEGTDIKLMASGRVFTAAELGIFVPQPRRVERLTAGEVGYLMAGIKDIKHARVGDTITNAVRPSGQALPGYRPATPMVFCGLYPVDSNDYHALREALEKLQLNDSSLVFEPDTSVALGFGFRCGFLGLLHMEIVQERLEREYQLQLITTAPGVKYQVTLHDGTQHYIENPVHFPAEKTIASLGEPFVRATLLLPHDYVGAAMELCQEKRGQMHNMEYLEETRVVLTYDLPLAEIVYDFFDQLKSRTRGYATMDYEWNGYRKTDLVRLDILINREAVDALSTVVHRDLAYRRGREVVDRLREIIPRQMFDVPIQAMVGNRAIARETVRAVKKDVLQKCYGGDVTRKRKLLERQKEGKKRMKQVGKVDVPQEAFMAVLRLR